MIKDILYPNGFVYKFNKKFVTNLEIEPGLDKIVQRFKPKSILELGSWHGKSAVSFANECLSQNLNTEILCVDTWLGSYEYWTTYTERLPLVLDSYDVFCSNIVADGLQNNVLPFRQTTKNAIQILKYHGVKFDLVYWDSDHSSVLQDLLMCDDVLHNDGVLIVDDYFQHQLVKQQVEDYLQLKQKERLILDDKIIIGSNQIKNQ